MTAIHAEIRSEIGRKANALRKRGVLPAVLYGKGVDSVPLSLPVRDFEKALAETGETSLLTIRVKDGKEYNVLIHDVARDPRTLKPIHADFYAVQMDKPIEAKVPLVFTGESPAVKNENGIFVKVIHELEVKALPKDLPHEITVDVTRLEQIGNKLHVKDILLPSGVVAEAGPEDVIALVEAPRAQEEIEVPAQAGAAEAEPAEVKTEREVKAEAKEKEKEAEAEEKEQK